MFSMFKRKTPYLILTAACLLVYANSLHDAFISDDIPAILENPQITQFCRFFFGPHSLLNSFTYLVSGNNPFGYHLINIILHSINTILVFKPIFQKRSEFLGWAFVCAASGAYGGSNLDFRQALPIPEFIPTLQNRGLSRKAGQCAGIYV
jgi:hypothetical protein